MMPGDFGGKEVGFLLWMSILAIALSWFITWQFWNIISLILDFELFVGFTIFSLLGFYHF